MNRPFAILLGLAACLLGCSAERAPAEAADGKQAAAGGATGLKAELGARPESQDKLSDEQSQFQQFALTVADPVGGEVLGPDGKPRAGARVVLYRRSFAWPRRGRTELDQVPSGVDGTFSFGITRGPNLEIEVTAPGCATLTRTAPPNVESVSMRLNHGFTVAGRVLLPGGRPAIACEVCLEPGVGCQMPAVATTTDAKGRFQFTGVPAESLRLTARHQDYAPVQVPSVTIGLRVGYDLQFRDSGLGLSGKVVAADSGAPLEGGRVQAYPLTPNGPLYIPFTAETSADGSFRLRGLGQGSYSIEVRHAGHSSVQRNVSLFRSRTAFQFELQPPVRVSGRLLGAKDLERSRLTLTSLFGEIATATIGPNGEFAFPGRGFSRGLATLELEESEDRFSRSQSRWLRVPLVRDGRSLEFEVQKASKLSGRVFGADGRPLRNVQVLAALEQIGDLGLLTARRRVLAVTDAKGCYTIRGLEPGEVDLGFAKEEFAYSQQKAQVLVMKKAAKAGPSNTTNLHRPGTISGLVTRGGRPAPGVLVFVGKGLSSLARTLTGPDGRYELRGLPAGQHRIRVKFSTLPIAHSDRSIPLSAGQLVSGVNIALPQGRRIQGRILDLEEAPMASVIVESMAGGKTRTDEKGWFEVDVPRGRTILNLRLGRAGPLFSQVVVRPKDRDIEVRLAQAPRGIVRGRVCGHPSGDPIDGVVFRLDVRGARTNPVPALTPQQSLTHIFESIRRIQELNRHHERGAVERWVETPDGGLDVQNLPNGSFHVILQARGFQPHGRKIEVLNGKPVDLGKVLLKPGARVRGVVLDPNGEPISGASIALGRESDLTLPRARIVYRSDSRGRFTVEGVGLAAKTLFLAAKGFATKRQELDLPDDLLREDPLRVQMQPGASIKVRVVDRQGEVLPFEVIELNRGIDRIGSAETDELGEAWFHNLSKGAYHMFLRGKLRTVQRQVVTTTRGGQVYEVKLRDLPRQRKRR